MIQKINEATRLVCSNLILFSSISLTIWLPGSILLVYLRSYVFPGTMGGDETRMLIQEFRVSNVIELAFGPLYIGALVHAAAQLKQGLPAKYGASMAYAAKRSFKFLGTRIFSGLIVGLGLLCFVIPGIVMALRFALIDSIVVLEDRSGVDAQARSTQLTQGKRWKILGTMTLTFIGLSLAFFLVSFTSQLLFALVGQSGGFIVAVIAECINNILAIVPVIVLFLFYWEAKNQDRAAYDSTPNSSQK
jgi:Uncharacterised protein family (UPF0259)